MKRIVWMVLLALALPLAAFANNTVDFQNTGGTLSGNNAGLSLSGSMLTLVDGLNGGGMVTGDLGSISFATGTLTGSLQNGATFASGGKFVITGNGSNGIPNSVIFNGSFTCNSISPCKWQLVTLANGTHKYTLTASISGTWTSTGKTVSGATFQVTINTGKGFFNGSTTLLGGLTDIGTTPAVPEPGTLGLLGTGLIGLAGALHRKFKA